MRLTVVGSGDAFGTGGRNQPCFLIEAAGETIMLDCGATTMSALARLGRDPNAIVTLVVSHLHGDHFGGLIFWVMQSIYGTRRTAPLTVFGPPTIEVRFRAAMEAFYPGVMARSLRFDLRFVELVPGPAVATGPLLTEAVEVDHPSGAPSYGFRLMHSGRTLAYTGDTRWTDALVPLGTGADLYIMECYAPEATPAAHLTWTIIRAALDRLGARRVLLVHMNAAMLARRSDVDDPRVMCADDGMVIDL